MTCGTCGRKVKPGKHGDCPVCTEKVTPAVDKAFATTLRRAQEQASGRGTDDRVRKAALLEPAYEEFDDPDEDQAEAEPEESARLGIQGELSAAEVALVNKAAQSAGIDPVASADDLEPGHAHALRRLAFNVPAFAEGAGRLAARIDGS